MQQLILEGTLLGRPGFRGLYENKMVRVGKPVYVPQNSSVEECDINVINRRILQPLLGLRISSRTFCRISRGGLWDGKQLGHVGW